MKNIDWWASDEPPPDGTMLWIDGRAPAQGPVLNVAVISAVAASYAPPGRHLIAASALAGRDGTPPTRRRRAGTPPASRRSPHDFGP